jgi:hypothetical protein
MLELTEMELDEVAGGPIWYRALQAARIGKEIGEELVELGERLHDAVCQH